MVYLYAEIFQGIHASTFIAQHTEFRGCVYCTVLMSVVKVMHSIRRLGIVGSDISGMLRKHSFEAAASLTNINFVACVAP